VQHAKNKYSILASLWKVFQILLEYCCKSNYQMMIVKLGTEHKEELEKMEELHSLQLQWLEENEK